MKLIKTRFILLFCFPVFSLTTSSAQAPVGAPSRALSGLGSLQAPGSIGIFNSPASGRWDSTRTLFSEYRNFFGIGGLSSTSLGLSTGINSLRVGILWNRTGSMYLNRQELRLQLAGRISELLTIGMGLHYRQSFMTGTYQQKGSPAVQLGVALKAGKKTDVILDWLRSLSFSANDWAGQYMGAAHLRAGVRHHVSKQAGLMGEIHARYGDYPNRSILRGGIWYRYGTFTFLAGTSNGPEPMSFGAVWRKRNITVACAASYHASLGFSPHFSATCYW
jgi:hypothetical protein